MILEQGEMFIEKIDRLHDLGEHVPHSFVVDEKHIWMSEQ